MEENQCCGNCQNLVLAGLPINGFIWKNVALDIYFCPKLDVFCVFLTGEKVNDGISCPFWKKKKVE